MKQKNLKFNLVSAIHQWQSKKGEAKFSRKLTNQYWYLEGVKIDVDGIENKIHHSDALTFRLNYSNIRIYYCAL